MNFEFGTQIMDFWPNYADLNSKSNNIFLQNSRDELFILCEQVRKFSFSSQFLSDKTQPSYWHRIIIPSCINWWSEVCIQYPPECLIYLNVDIRSFHTRILQQKNATQKNENLFWAQNSSSCLVQSYYRCFHSTQTSNHSFGIVL